MFNCTDACRHAIKNLKRPFKKFIYYIKYGLSYGMSTTGEWLIYNAQRFSPYKFRAYQPMPWIGLKTRKRDESTLLRWQAIEENLDIESGTAMDIGSNLGHFVLRLAEKGFYSIGIDMAYGNVKIAQYVQRKAGIENAAFSVMAVTPDNASLLPAVDVLVFFSVWHHWITAYGLENASEMLRVIWGKTRHVMYFETGEDTEIKHLKITGKPVDWVRSQLELACPNATIKVIGEFDRGTHQRIKLARTLFAVYRQGN
jgi:2-polyprenyl-3-methyl-5-hydroxy-6-metoxy-1,4-benzoquinol methylase